ncbi:unnamed protein product, partial [marine sediment metagenome]
MEKHETQTSEEAHVINGELATILRVLSRPVALKILNRAGQGIENSTYAIEELNLTPKKYYHRLNELMASDLVKKVDGVYRQTAMGRIIYDRFLPAMGKTINAKDKLELIVHLEETELENGVRKRIEEELGIPIFTDSTNVKVLRDYEALAIEAIDLYDSAEESVLLASNYIDVRVMEACFRSTERGITNRIIIGKKSLKSKLNNLRMMLSLTFAKTIINFTSNKVKIQEFLKFIDLPYTFCIVDGHRNIIEVSNSLNESFIVA